MKLSNMVGYKLFKELDDDKINLIRIKSIKKSLNAEEPKSIMIYQYSDGSTISVDKEYLKGYTPLEPDGYMTFNVVELHDETSSVKDVIVTANKVLNMKIGDTLPYAVCRQNVTDVFFNLLCNTEDDMMVGLSVNRDTCPAGFDYGMMLGCDSILSSESVNFYRTDTLEDILGFIHKLKYDTVLSTLYAEHVKYVNDPKLMLKSSDKGWCKNLITLLQENNFQNDVNQMLGITDINPIISKYIVKKLLPDNETTYDSLSDELIDWLREIFKVNIKDITVIKYDHDINMADFNNSRYFLLRDPSKELYLAVYTIDDEYLEADLKAASEHKDFSTDFRINFVNKYKGYNNKDNNK